MPLPADVQVAINALTRCGVDAKDITPPLYRWYLRHEPATPPPLWDANAGYWVAQAISVALGFGVAFTAFAVWFMGFGAEPGTLKKAQLVFLISQVGGWTLAGFIGWLWAAERRRQMRHLREDLGLPAWSDLHPGWRPSVERLRSRAVPQRYWLHSLRADARFTNFQIIGCLLFALLCWVFPAHMAKVSLALASVYLFACAFAVQRTSRAIAMPRGAGLWVMGHGLASGALIAALVWNVVAAEILEFPREPVVFALVLASFCLHAWEQLMFEQDRSKALRAESAEQGRQLAEARLHALTAQIEPHFIFNTLAHLKSMMTTDTMAAQQMADELSDFLRASLSALRRDRATVEDEMALVRAYLGIARLRLGERLAVDIHVEDNVSAYALPSHLLLTLVENAVQHGIEPLSGPGRIEVEVTRREDQGMTRLVMKVTDNGAGFGNAATAGAGTGLANVRERIASAFGVESTLRLTANDPRGVIAELDLLLPPAPDSRS